MRTKRNSRPEFVTAFDLGVPPYASAFLESDGRTGRSVTQHILDVLAADGLPPITDEVAACHLGVLLAHAGRLCAAGHSERAAAFVQREVLSWLPAFVVATESLPVPRWQAILRLTLDLVAEHGAREGPAVPRNRPVDAPGHPLFDPDAGLRDIASFLEFPARCWYGIVRFPAVAVVEDGMLVAIEHACTEPACRRLLDAARAGAPLVRQRQW